MRFPIRFDTAFRVLSRTLLLSPDEAYVEVADDLMHVKFSWAFRATFPRSSVASTSVYPRKPLSRGVHGFGGRWLVNGAGDGILELAFEPAQRAHVLGWPVTLRCLLVSLPRREDFASVVVKCGPGRDASPDAITIIASKIRREFLKTVIVTFSSGCLSRRSILSMRSARSRPTDRHTRTARRRSGETLAWQ